MCNENIDCDNYFGHLSRRVRAATTIAAIHYRGRILRPMRLRLERSRRRTRIDPKGRDGLVGVKGRLDGFQVRAKLRGMFQSGPKNV
jgi:hypothetical protein